MQTPPMVFPSSLRVKSKSVEQPPRPSWSGPCPSPLLARPRFMGLGSPQICQMRSSLGGFSWNASWSSGPPVSKPQSLTSFSSSLKCLQIKEFFLVMLYQIGAPTACKPGPDPTSLLLITFISTSQRVDVFPVCSSREERPCVVYTIFLVF